MTKEEFTTQLNRLIDVYSEKAYPRDRIEQIWLKVKWRHASVFQEAINYLIGDSAQAPMLGKIMEACFVMQRKFPELEVDPYKEVREKLKAMQKTTTCYRCQGLGHFCVYQKFHGLAMRVLTCRCESGSVARQLPEFRTDRAYETHDPFYLIMDFDPNKEEKFSLYRDFYFENSTEAQSALEKIYYSKEVFMDPCYWFPAGWDYAGRLEEYKKLQTASPVDVNSLVRTLAKEKGISP